jgi:YVTN family beta-propeller protein
MNLRISGLIAAFALAGILGSAQTLAQNAYIANGDSNNVSVIDTQTNTVIGSPIPVGHFPWGVAVSPDGGKVYVTVINGGTERTYGVSGSVAVIDTRTNTVVATFPAGNNPLGVAVSPDGRRVYIANDLRSSTVTVIDAASGAIVATIPLGDGNANAGVAVSPDGSKVYALMLSGAAAVAVIDTATNAVVATISTPSTFNAIQAVFSPDGAKAYSHKPSFRQWGRWGS